MKSIDTILDENEHVYLWGDPDHTLDVCIYNPDTTFAKHLMKFKCLVCDNFIIRGNENLLNSITDTIRGASIQCKHCEQTHFVHFYVKPIKNR